VELHEDIVKRLAKLFKKIDLDGNGNLEREEIFKFCGGSKQMAADLMFDLDEDQDGQVTMEEWMDYWGRQMVRYIYQNNIAGKSSPPWVEDHTCA